ncbi:MAG: leucine-rich repeat domain-containing protein, partial [Myxococcota bacterium]
MAKDTKAESLLALLLASDASRRQGLSLVDALGAEAPWTDLLKGVALRPTRVPSSLSLQDAEAEGFRSTEELILGRYEPRDQTPRGARVQLVLELLGRAPRSWQIRQTKALWVHLFHREPLDLAALAAAFPAIESLVLSGCTIEGLDPLAALPSLRELRLYRVLGAGGTRPLACARIGLGETSLEDGTPVSQATHLTLHSGLRPDVLRDMVGLTHFRSVGAFGCSVALFDALTSLPLLESVRVEGTQRRRGAVVRLGGAVFPRPERSRAEAATSARRRARRCIRRHQRSGNELVRPCR